MFLLSFRSTNQSLYLQAQNEIKEILEKLENKDVDLENSKEHYNRMMQLNYHIQDLFKKKANEIKESVLKRKEKVLKNLK